MKRNVPAPVVAVDCGTSKTIALVGELQDDNTIAIIGMGDGPTLIGVEFDKAAANVGKLFADASASSDVTIHQAYVAVSCSSIRSVANQSAVPFLDAVKDGCGQDCVKILGTIPIHVPQVLCSGFCSALGVLTAEQLQRGALVIDIGAGGTTFVAFAKGNLAAVGDVAAGGKDVTDDIARAFGITYDRAEHLKCSSGPVTADNMKTISSSDSSESLSNVIAKRLQNIFTNILAKIEKEGIQKQIAAGVVLTGGGSKTEGLVAIAESVFQRSCVVGCPVDYAGLNIIRSRPEYSAVAGLVRYGFSVPSQDGSDSLFNRLL